ncbi:hypothetical protein SEA_LILMAC1015_18 [Arthrobacter phage Lilmac1015]|uniref:Uncharacterized protein n=1 Tax=Arthrobacter phage Lilmac1015 TaxID=2912653 RepID=A0AA49BNM3_9CAUD|nr:hypothetical protein SEA_LILMAC1015_18 [Arthrobacter phage Lilmac1015]
MGRGLDAAGPYRRLSEWLAEDDRFKLAALTAYALRLDPVVLLTEADPRLNAVRYAAADVIAEARRSAEEKNKPRRRG